MFSLASPTLLVNKEKCMANIRRMKDKADSHGLKLKPHVKTHQSTDIGDWMKDAGIQAITVSSVRMAAWFADNGWNDITIAFPVNPLEIGTINKLAEFVQLSLLISDEASVKLLDSQLEHPVSMYIETDTGSGRTGFTSGQISTLRSVADDIQHSSLLKLKGLYSHPGHSYRCRSQEEILLIHEEVRMQMLDIKHQLKPYAGSLSICIGDTPCCSVGKDFEDIDEISPGNFIFYDLMQTHIGSCSLEDIAVVLAVPVAAVYPHRQEIAVHGGAVHLSKDHYQLDGQQSFGSVVRFNDTGWTSPLDNCYVKALSQEHGIIKCSQPVLQDIEVGEIIGVLPVHSCLTADLMMGYQTLDGEKLNHIRASHFYK